MYDPVAKTDTIVNLPLVPLSLSVGPDGMYAAVGHDAWVSYVALSPASLVKTMPVSAMANSVVLAGNDYIYVLPNRYLRVSTGVAGLVSPSSVSFSGKGRLHPNGQTILAVSPYSFLKFDIREGPQKVISGSGSVSACERFWYLNGGVRALTGCGAVLEPSTSPDTNTFQNAGTLPRQDTRGNSVSAAAQTGYSPMALVRPDSYPGLGDQLALFNATTLAAQGTISLGLDQNGFYVSGRYAFYNSDASRLTIVGTTALDWFIRTFDIAGSAACPVQMSADTTGFPAHGGSLNLTVVTPETCLWTLQRSSSRISVPDGDSGAGSKVRTVMAPPNGAGTAHTFTISTGGASILLTQPVSQAPNFVSILPYGYVASAYDRNGDRLALVTKDPNQFHLWSTAKGGITGVIDLPLLPASVALTSDGAYAAVGHDKSISYINLENLSIVRSYPIARRADSIVIASGYIHTAQQYSGATSINIVTGVSVESNTSSAPLRLQPGTRHLYSLEFFPRKFDSSVVPLTSLYTLSQTNCSSSQGWFTETGDRVLTACGSVLRTSDVPAEDLSYRGTLAGVSSLVSAAHSRVLRLFAVATQSSGSQTQFFTDDFLNPAGTSRYTAMSGGQIADQYFSADATHLYGILTGSDGSRFAIETLETSGNCTVTLGSPPPAISAMGGNASVTVTAASGCKWRATTADSWITLSDSTGAEPGTFTLSAATNTSSVSRSGKVSVNGVEVTITQSGMNFNAAARPVSIMPNAGSISIQTFFARFSGTPGLLTAHVSFGNNPASAGGCTIEFNRLTGGFRLLDENALAWISAAGGKLSNSQCSIEGYSSLIDGDSLTLVLPVSFRPAFNGARSAHLLANNNQWRKLGTYTIGAGTAAAPGVGTILPESGAGSANTFTALFSHTGGASQHYLGYMLFLRTPNIVWYTAKNSCLVEYNRISNGMRLINDAGDGWLGGVSGIPLGTAGATLSNAQCSVNVAGATAKVDGMAMRVTAPVTFVSASPVSATFLQAFDVNGQYTGMTQVGNWVAGLPATPAPGPAIGGVSVSPSTGNAYTVTAGVSHTGGTGQLSAVHLRFGTSVTAPAPCHIIYFPVDNSLNLIADNDVVLVGPNVPVGSASTLSNSRCSVNASVASRSMGGTSLALTLPVSFVPAAFDGDRYLYVNAFDNAGNLTHWVTAGSIRVY